MLLLISATGCGQHEAPDSVVVYVSADDHIARLLIQRFEDQHGIDVRMVGDTEAKKTTGLVQRLRQEQDNPQADVFWSSEIFMTMVKAHYRPVYGPKRFAFRKPVMIEGRLVQPVDIVTQDPSCDDHSIVLATGLRAAR